MLPTIQIFGKTIGMYGLMIVIGLLAGTLVAVLRSKKYGIQPEDTLFASFFGGIGLFIGAKLLYILTIIPELLSGLLKQSEVKDLLALLLGGYVFYGGLMGAIAGCFLYCRIYHLPFARIIDLIIPSIPLIHSFGRLGCNFAGCCYGIHYDGPFHVIFHRALFAPNGIPLFPTQLVESGSNFLIAIILFLYARHAKKPGNVSVLYLMMYSVVRFIMEFVRGDVARGILLGLSTSQWVSLAFLPLGLWFMLRCNSNKSGDRDLSYM